MLNVGCLVVTISNAIYETNTVLFQKQNPGVSMIIFIFFLLIQYKYNIDILITIFAILCTYEC